MFTVILIFLITLEANYSLSKNNSPENYFNLCHRNDPDLNSCVQQAIMSGLPNFIKGIPEISLPPIEPLYVEIMNMTEGTGNFKLVIILKHMQIYGFEKMTAKNLRIDLTNEPYVSIKLDLIVPNVFAPGKYKVDGKFLLIYIRGDGDFRMNATSVTVNCLMKGQTKFNPKDQRKYLIIDTFSVYLNVKDGLVQFTNLFGGNKILGRAINRFFRDNFADIFDSIRQLPQRGFGQAFKDYVNTIFQSYPFDDLLL